MKKVSIILPCYNAEKTVTETLDSVINQTFPLNDLEIIVVDDCSSDGTLDILQDYERRYPDLISLIHFDINQKQGYARNVAITYASAPYVMYVDSDDWLTPNAVKEAYTKIRELDAEVLEFSFVSCRDKFALENEDFENDTGSMKVVEIADDTKRREFYIEGGKYGYPWNKIYKKDFLLVNSIKFDEGLKYEDTMFVFMMVLYIKKYAYYDRCLYGYRINYEGTSFGCRLNDIGQFDRFLVQFNMLKECKKRGLLQPYYDMIEANFLRVGYVETFIPVLQRFEHLPKELLEIGKIAKSIFPNYKNNIYLNLPHTKWCLDVLETIDYEMTEEDFQNIKKTMAFQK